MRVARHAVGRCGETLVTLGLGSCVVIVLHDPAVCIGGLAHALLPAPVGSGPQANPYKFVATAVPELLDSLCALGARRRRVEARLVGGAGMFAALLNGPGLNTGARNLEAARDALAALRVPLVGEDVGGDWGRSVYYHVGDGRVRVTSVYRDDVVL